MSHQHWADRLLPLVQRVLFAVAARILLAANADMRVSHCDTTSPPLLHIRHDIGAAQTGLKHMFNAADQLHRNPMRANIPCKLLRIASPSMQQDRQSKPTLIQGQARDMQGDGTSTLLQVINEYGDGVAGD